MNWEAVGAIAELIRAIAVVFSLVYLATQIRLSNSLAITQTRRDMLHSTQQELYKVVEHPEIFEAFTKEHLDREEKVKLNEWLISDLRGREFEWLQFRDKTIDSDTYESYKEALTINLGTPRTREWWKANRTFFDPGFACVVDAHLEKAPLTNFFSSIDKWN